MPDRLASCYRILSGIELKPTSCDQLIPEGTWVASPVFRFGLDFAQIARLLHYKTDHDSGSSVCSRDVSEIDVFQAPHDLQGGTVGERQSG